MLADDFINWKDLTKFGEGGKRLKTAIQTAHRFVLDPGVTYSASLMSTEQLRSVLELCKLPFDSIWIEFTNADRANATTLAEGTVEINKIGMHAVMLSDGGILISLFWRYKVHGLAMCPMSCIIHPDRLDDRGMPLGQNLINPYWMALIVQIPEDYRNKLLADAEKDWLGESHFFFSVLALLNAKNGATVTHRPIDEKLNRARKHLGRKPLLDYHEVILRVGRTETSASSASEQTREAMRAHTVRGHFKRRSSGIYWWSPFIRGDASKGFVTKSYKVTKED